MMCLSIVWILVCNSGMELLGKNNKLCRKTHYFSCGSVKGRKSTMTKTWECVMLEEVKNTINL